MNASTALSDEQASQVAEAIGQVEARTSAEIVCAVATESGRYDRSEVLCGVVLAAISLVVAHTFRFFNQLEQGSFEEVPALGPAWQVGILVGGVVIGTVLASYWHGLRQVLVGSGIQREEVDRAATYVFATSGMTATRQGTGVLIYVSLFERRVVVLADHAALAVLGESGLETLRDTAVSHLKRGAMVDTFVETINQAADSLSEKLPADPGQNPDELANQVLRFHPRP